MWLVQGFVQDATHNLRYPMLPNLFVMLLGLGLYVWCDVDKGIEDAKVPLRDGLVKRVAEEE